MRPLKVLFSSLGQALPPWRERASSCGCLSFSHTSSPATSWPGTQESPGFTSNSKHLSLKECRYFQCLDLGPHFLGTPIEYELLQLLKHKFGDFYEFGCYNGKQHETSWNVKSSWPWEALLRTKVVEVMEFQLSEILKDVVKVLHSICQEIWKTQQWRQDWKRSVFIPIPNGDAKECSNYHTIVIISPTSKVILKIHQDRL